MREEDKVIAKPIERHVIASVPEVKIDEEKPPRAKTVFYTPNENDLIKRHLKLYIED